MKKSSRSSSKVTFVSEKPEKNVKPVFIFVIFVVMLLSAAYLYIKNGMDDKKVQTAATSTEMVNQEPETVQPQTLLDKLKKHLLVTETDIPYIATITNVNLVKEKNPDFYANASDGDKVIVWKDRAVIYSESQDRIVAVATAKPLLTTGASGQGMASSTPAVTETDAEAITRQIASTTIEIRNGSRKNGAARTLKTQLETAGLHVAKVGDTGMVYQGTQIIDLTQGNVPAALDLILKTASGTAATVLPEGEKPTTAQVLVIIGK